LTFLLILYKFSLVIPKDLTKYQNEVKDLNAQISLLNEKIENNEKQISDLVKSFGITKEQTIQSNKNTRTPIITFMAIFKCCFKVAGL